MAGKKNTKATTTAHRDPLAHVPAPVAGAAGGFISGLEQFYATTLDDFWGHLISGEWLAAMNLFGITAHRL
jgi:hypothetical protein